LTWSRRLGSNGCWNEVTSCTPSGPKSSRKNGAKFTSRVSVEPAGAACAGVSMPTAAPVAASTSGPRPASSAVSRLFMVASRCLWRIMRRLARDGEPSCSLDGSREHLPGHDLQVAVWRGALDEHVRGPSIVDERTHGGAEVRAG